MQNSGNNNKCSMSTDKMFICIRMLQKIESLLAFCSSDTKLLCDIRMNSIFSRNTRSPCLEIWKFQEYWNLDIQKYEVMYVCRQTHMYVCRQADMHLVVCMCSHVNTCTYIHTHRYRNMYEFICIYLHMNLCIYVWLHAYIFYAYKYLCM